MASNWISDIAWDGDRPYRTFLTDAMGQKAGTRTYVSPAEVNPQNTTDPRLLQWAASHAQPGASFARERGTWNSQTGDWDRGLNWGNLGSLAVGGLIAAPAVVGALGAGSGAAGAGAGTTTMAAPGLPVVAGAGNAVAHTLPPLAAAKGGLSLSNLALTGLQGGVQLAGAIIGGNKQAKAAQAALDFEKAQEARRQYEWDTQQGELKRQWDARQALLTPYRDASLKTLAQIQNRAPGIASWDQFRGGGR